MIVRDWLGLIITGLFFFSMAAIPIVFWIESVLPEFVQFK